MDNQLNILLVFAAGLASVLSPCVLPVIPIIVTGSGDDHKLRPILIVAGLAATFAAMGVLSSLFGSAIGGSMGIVEKAGGIVIAVLGLLLILNVNLFKHLGFFSQFAAGSHGRLGGFLLGATLGIVWIPCIGPMLSSVLAMVATNGKLVNGVLLLLVYALGFAVPMLAIAYASQFFRNRFRKIASHPYLINIISGLVLLAMGLLIVFKGSVTFGF
jgi:cytochrome c-type biogenesis protein